MKTVVLHPSDFLQKVVPLVHDGWKYEVKVPFSPARERFARERVFLDVSRAGDVFFVLGGPLPFWAFSQGLKYVVFES